MKKRNLCYFLMIMLITSIFIGGCGKSSNDSDNSNKDKKEKQVTINVLSTAVGEQAKVFKEITDNFMKENKNIKVEFSTPGKDYEKVMKVKMSSKDLPDVFCTHGWSQKRYGEYLLDLKDEKWAKDIDDSIKSSVVDKDGKVYALPIDQDKNGIIYNVDILKKYNIDIPKTYDELIKACEEIKTKSNGEITPIHIGGGDVRPVGQYFDYFASSLLISPEKNYKKELLDGSFDWNNFKPLPEKFLHLHKKGYLNKDVLTSKYTDSAEEFAKGKVAFTLYGPYIIQESLKINPNFKAGIMPIPALIEGDSPSFAGGEKNTWGIWKDSKNIDAAKKYVEYFSKPENVKKITKSTMLPPGLKNVEIDAGALTESFEKYKDVRVFTYFDRIYLPGGMWQVMNKNGQSLLSGEITPEQFTENMKNEYLRLRKDNK